jgi:hypothetical protein
MLEPRIVAASTHGRDFAAHLADGVPLLTDISLHGCFIPIPMPRDRERIPSKNLSAAADWWAAPIGMSRLSRKI